jgi:hypothetical protein
MSMRIGAACLASLLPLLSFAVALPYIAQALSPSLGMVAPEEVMDRDAVPPGAFLTIRGTPKSAVTIGPPDTIEALSIFQEAPHLVLYSPHHLPYSREVLSSEKDGEFYQQQWTVQGRIDIPPGTRRPPKDLKRFVTAEIGPDGMDDIRLLYVGAKAADSEGSALGFGALGVISLIIALAAWIGVLIPLLRGKSKAAEADG